jgi:hypothetical protein
MGYKILTDIENESMDTGILFGGLGAISGVIWAQKQNYGIGAHILSVMLGHFGGHMIYKEYY